MDWILNKNISDNKGSIILSSMKLNDEFIKPLFKLFQAGVRVKKLNLKDNLISDVGIKLLVESMNNNSP